MSLLKCLRNNEHLYKLKQLLPAFGQLESVKIKISLDIKKSVLICANLWTKRTQPTDGFYRPQINTDWHRLRAEGSEWIDYGFF